LVATPSCAEIVMINRKTTPLADNHRVRQVILDAAAAQFLEVVTELVQNMVALGDPVYGASWVGVGKGSNAWTDGRRHSRFGLLSAVGCSPKSRIRYARVMGLKEETDEAIGFKRSRSCVPASSAATRTRPATSRDSASQSPNL
jgi:hypothetical protein